MTRLRTSVPEAPPRRPHLAPFALLAPLLALGLGSLSCGKPDSENGAPDSAALVARERAAGLFAEERTALAYEALAPLLASDPIAVEDLVRAAILELILGSSPANDLPDLVPTAEARLREAIERAPDDPAAYFILAQHLLDQGFFEQALPLAERAAELAPSDAPTQLLLGSLLSELYLDAADDQTAAALAVRSQSIFEGLLERGVEFLGSWILPTLYRYSSLLLYTDRLEESNSARDRWKELLARGLPQPSATDFTRGTFGKLSFPDPVGALASPVAKLETRSDGRIEWPAQMRRVEARTLDERNHWISLAAVDPNLDPAQSVDGRAAGNIQIDARIGAASLVGDDGRTVWIVEPDEAGRWTPRPWFESTAELEAWETIDLGEDRGLDQIVEGRDAQGRPYRIGALNAFTGAVVAGVEPSDLELLVAAEGRLQLVAAELDAPLEIARYAGRLAQAVPVDIDHDGDLDVVAVGDFGLLLLRHDGAELLLRPSSGEDAGEPANEEQPAKGDGRFTEASEQFGRLEPEVLRWIVAEDFDTDGDVDLLAGGPDGLVWLSSDRNERWTDRSAALPDGLDASSAPLVADFNGNGVPDLWTARDGRLWFDLRGDGFAPADSAPAPAPDSSRPRLIDVDLDGAVDVLWSAAGTLGGVLAPGLDGSAPVPAIELPGAGPLVIADLDADGRLELAAAGAGELLELGGSGGVLLVLDGVKDNPRGIGATVELRAGAVYRRLRWTGEPMLLGAAGRDPIDVLRVTWPNGVVQSELDAPTGGRRVLEQIEGLVGSCPFLYTWDGERFVFVTDVIGITPLGLPMAPGMLVPPDHDEYVLVSAEQLAPRADGALVLQITEELREVTYLDQLRLTAVDHPEGTEVFPTERFSFPPFPEPHTHLVERTAPLTAALDDAGRDWAQALAETDGELAEPFESLRGQWLGLATPHTLELRFDPEALRDAGRLRLLMTGWLYWTDASVNVASARHPEREFVPPILQVPDGAGGWRDTGPPIGFPAGKTKTMVIDVTDLIDPADPRLRLFTTLRLFWDSIRLATDGDDGERRETTLEPVAASLWERGFSAPVFLGGDERLEWFDWERLAAPRWNQHPGLYTRHGDVLELLDEVDDRFVVMGSGDALEVTFDGTQLPPLRDGWRRDWMVFLDGWAKDRDLNTYEAEYVEPLPFHGMSGYPYGPDERYPDDAIHRDYQQRWNTRPARRWIEDLAGPGSAGAPSSSR
jgi:hypothetical protein